MSHRLAWITIGPLSWENKVTLLVWEGILAAATSEKVGYE
jgi:hypothetical protein